MPDAIECTEQLLPLPFTRRDPVYRALVRHWVTDRGVLKPASAHVQRCKSLVAFKMLTTPATKLFGTLRSQPLPFLAKLTWLAAFAAQNVVFKDSQTLQLSGPIFSLGFIALLSLPLPQA